MIDIHIDEETAIINLENNNRKSKKIVTLKNLREAIGIRDQTYDSGFLPGRYGTKRIYEDSNKEMILYTSPAERRKVVYSYVFTPRFDTPLAYTEEDYENTGHSQGDMSDEDYQTYLEENWEDEILEDLRRESRFSGYMEAHPRVFDIMVPPTVMIARKAKGTQNGSVKLFTNGLADFISEDQDIYRYPAPNIFPEGTICWGDHDSDVRIQDIKKIQGLVPNFLSTDFNNDLAGGRINGNIVHFWEEMDNAFRDGKSEEEVLEMYESKLIRESSTINHLWNR